MIEEAIGVRPDLASQVALYRWKFLDIMAAAGEDVSDIDNPDQIVSPDISNAALECVRQLRADYDEALSVQDDTLREIEWLRVQLDA